MKKATLLGLLILGLGAGLVTTNACAAQGEKSPTS